MICFLLRLAYFSVFNFFITFVCLLVCTIPRNINSFLVTLKIIFHFFFTITNLNQFHGDGSAGSGEHAVGFFSIFFNFSLSSFANSLAFFGESYSIYLYISSKFSLNSSLNSISRSFSDIRCKFFVKFTNRIRGTSFGIIYL